MIIFISIYLAIQNWYVEMSATEWGRIEMKKINCNNNNENI